MALDISTFGQRLPAEKKINKEERDNHLLIEAAWEVCNQVGGIYTVIRSKVPSVLKKWRKENYCLMGPYINKNVDAVFEPVTELDYNNPIDRAVKQMWDWGYEVHYGTWLITGKPKVVLFNPFHVYDRLDKIKTSLWESHKISIPDHDDLIHQVCALGFQMREFLRVLGNPDINQKPIIAHFHEWMAATPIPDLRKDNLAHKIVFTTHATILGRYLAGNDPVFYEYLPFFNWEEKAEEFAITAQVQIERAAAHGSHVFTTVSEVTGRECTHLLGRDPDVILPNGINIERFEALHEFQNLHLEYKRKIHTFIMGHFFQSYSFDLDNTLYFFTSGRYEYKNKGYDLTLEALARLNWKMKEANIDKTVVAFFITKRPVQSVNPNVLHSRAVMDELRTTCKSIEEELGKRLFYEAVSSMENRMPDLNKLVDEYMSLRLRRTLQSWRSPHLPSLITHNLQDDSKDEILNFFRNAQLFNNESDRVKFVYHPDFISPTSPLFGMEYGQFVRGCHLGVFPSYYEPWGYTPLECIASGLPTITSDLSGFGDFVEKNFEESEESGAYVVKRKHGDFNRSAEEMANTLFRFVQLDRRERITLRNQVEDASVFFDWDNLGEYYDVAYKRAAQQ